MMNFTSSGQPIADDPADYPPDWTPQQRLTAYWYANGHHIAPTQTAGWHAVLAEAHREAERRHTKIAELRQPETVELNTGARIIPLPLPRPDDEEPF